MKDYTVKKCPKCSQQLRFPNNIGGILMACPTCGNKFYPDFKLGSIKKGVEIIMKIAVPTIGEQIDQDFDNCGKCTIFTVEGKLIKAEEIMEASANCGVKLSVSNMLAQCGVMTLIAGGIGDGAVNVLGIRGIRTIKGVSGTAKNAVESFLRGELRG
jgi:predicted Fe-Mo cluster-binding NifX family protein